MAARARKAREARPWNKGRIRCAKGAPSSTGLARELAWSAPMPLQRQLAPGGGAPLRLDTAPARPDRFLHRPQRGPPPGGDHGGATATMQLELRADTAQAETASPELVVVIPTFNERDNIGPLLDKL